MFRDQIPTVCQKVRSIMNAFVLFFKTLTLRKDQLDANKRGSMEKPDRFSKEKVSNVPGKLDGFVAVQR